MSTRLTVQAIALLVLQIPLLAAPSMSSLLWWTEGPLVKVRPGDRAPEPARRDVDIYAARNEFEPFQLVLRADKEDVEGLDVDLSDFRTADGAALSRSNAAVYLERFVNIKQPSLAGGHTGPWPDPLIPRVDRYFHERRNAFPFRIRSGEDQPVWIEVFVPPDTLPGKYEASLKILEQGTIRAAVPVTLTVWAFTLPSTSSLTTSFGFNGTTALKAHRGSYTSDDDLYAITRTYTLAALEHRLSINGGSQVSPKYRYANGEMSLDWAPYDEEMGPFLNGTAIPKGQPLYGARATSTELRTPGSFPDEEQRSLYLRAWVSHFRKEGWIDRLFLYLWDEPAPDDYPKVLARAHAAINAAPSIRNLVTVPLSSKLEDGVQIWVPLVNCLEKRPGFDDFCHDAPAFSAYTDELRRGKSLWFYQSCASHGCGGQGGSYFEGWPSYMVDASGISNRLMPWIAWKYRISGELYYNTDEAYGRPGDPWSNLLIYGGNGDGTLFYPGRPANIGGQTDIPVESIRLQLIREGLEDYEYLVLLAATCGEKTADDFVAKIVQKPWASESRPEVFAQIRLAMGRALDRAKAAGGVAK